MARAEDYGFEVVGIQRGWKGLIEPAGVKLSDDKVHELVGVEGLSILTFEDQPVQKHGRKPRARSSTVSRSWVWTASSP